MTSRASQLARIFTGKRNSLPSLDLWACTATNDIHHPALPTHDLDKNRAFP